MSISRHPLAGPQPAWSTVPVDQAVVARLRTSFRALAADGARFASIFYARLFERYPGVRAFLPSDLSAQERKLTDSLGVVVEHLDAPAAMRARLLEMGQRHATYGAKPEHYPIVCEIMIESMAVAAGKAWGPTLTTEWAQALDIVSAIMLEGVPKPGEDPAAKVPTRRFAGR